MRELRTEHVPGTGVAVVGAGAVVLLPADVEPRLAREVHEVLLPGAGVPDVLQVLTGEFATSLARIPPFAVAVLTPSGVHAVARGDAVVRVDGAGGAEVSGEGVSTWSERFFAGAEAVELAVGAAVTVDDDALWPLDGGIVRADAVRSVRGTEAPARSGARPAPVAETPEPVVEPTPGPAGEPAVTSGPTGAPEPADVSSETVVPSDADVPSETVVPDEGDSFDHLWGSTVLRPVEAAAVRPEEHEPADDPFPPAASREPLAAGPHAPGDPAPATVPSTPLAPAGQPAAQAGSAPAPDRPTTDAPRTDEPTLAQSGAPDEPGQATWTPPFTLDAPASTAAAAPDAAAPEAAAPDPDASASVEETPWARLGDHDGLTIVRSQPAVVTPTPPPAATGRLGRARLSTGAEIPLDRPVVLGRKPRVSRVGGAAVPRLVTVPSPEQDISRSHLEVRLEGVSVLVVDLGSTNGSTLLRRGQLPVRLHPHEAVLVVEGDVVDLGEGVTVTFEGLS